jgi:hypothetical protein
MREGTEQKQDKSSPMFCLLLCAVCLLISACRSGHSKTRASKDAPLKSWEEIAGTDPAESGSYSLAKQTGTITDKRLAEISGITAGRANASVWWVHNDSGDQANLHALDQSGRLLATFSVRGARNTDWEDLGSGPGRDGKAALYIADIGDNSRRREELVIYRVSEPLLKKGVLAGATETAEAFPFKYPDGKYDAEAIFVDQKSGRIYVVTKVRGMGCGVYRFPLPLTPGKQVTLEKVKGSATGEIAKLPLVTGAAAAPDGSRVVIRTYFNALELRRAKGRAFETIFDAAPTPVSIPLERQGEAIAYTADSKAIVTTSEKIPAPIYQLTRQ